MNNTILAFQSQEVAGVYEVSNSGQTSGSANPEDWFIHALGGGLRSDSGMVITPRKALMYGSVFSAVSIISGDVAGVPIDKMRSEDGFTWTPMLDDVPSSGIPSTSYLLNVQPNPLMSGLNFRETIQSHALLWGNGYAAIARDTDETPLMLVPMLPDRTFFEKPPKAPVARYYTQWEETGERQYFRPMDVLHIKGLGYDGYTGYSVVQFAKNSWGLGLSAEKAANSHFKNEGRPNVVLEHPARLTEEQATDLLAKWQERQAGLDNVGRPALATGGLKVVPLPPMPAKDAQMLETRQFQREDVAAWFRMPAHKLGVTNARGYNTIEAENRAYVAQTLRHWFEKWNSELRLKLLSNPERISMRRKYRHNTADLLEANIDTRADVATKLRAGMIASQNEARHMVGLPPVDGGESFENPNTSANGQAVEALRTLLNSQFEAAFQAEASQIKRFKDTDKFYVGWRRKLSAFIGDAIAMANSLGFAVDVEQVIEDVISESMETGEQNWKGRADETVDRILD